MRILASQHGKRWVSTARLSSEGIDLRDPKLSITPEGKLMLLCGWRTWPPRKKWSLRSCVSFSDDGKAWTPLRHVLGENTWLWRVTWRGKVAWGVAYGPGNPAERNYGSFLVRSSDGLAYEKVCTFTGYPGLTEATLRFEERGTTMYCFHRRDKGTRTALLGKSTPPYTHWEWRDTGRYWGGPNMIRHNGKWYAAGRNLNGSARTVLGRVDLENGRIHPILTLPSGGDTSYPGLVSFGGELWMSYYSSHQGRAAIYLARVRTQR